MQRLKIPFTFIKKHKILSGIFFIIFSIILISLLRPKNNTSILTQAVTDQDVTKTVSVTGSIGAENTVNLNFLAGGKLVYLGAKVGDSVTANQTIASLDTSTVQKNLKASLIAYSKQRSTFDQTLENNNAKSPTDAASNAVKTVLENNQFDLDAAVNSVELQRLALDNSYLITPISGILTRADVKSTGINIAATTTFTVTDPTSLDFAMDVDEADIGQVKEGQEVDVTLDSFPNNTLHLTVDSIDFVSHTTSSGGNAFTVKAKLQNENYRVGMSGNADIIVDSRKNVLAVPSSSVFDDHFVYVKVSKGFVKRDVTVGIQSDTLAEITSGLSNGEVVAIDPNSIPVKSIVSQ